METLRQVRKQQKNTSRYVAACVDIWSKQVKMSALPPGRLKTDLQRHVQSLDPVQASWRPLPSGRSTAPARPPPCWADRASTAAPGGSFSLPPGPSETRTVGLSATDACWSARCGGQHGDRKDVQKGERWETCATPKSLHSLCKE